MSQLVHVVAPSGVRTEYMFADTSTPEHILAQLQRPDVKRVLGVVGTVLKKDVVFGEVVPHPDHASGFIMDHPDTIVVVGYADEAGVFVETKRLKGPPAKVEAKPADPLHAAMDKLEAAIQPLQDVADGKSAKGEDDDVDLQRGSPTYPDYPAGGGNEGATADEAAGQ